MKNIWGGVQFADMVKGNRVRPWMRDEHILVDGFELVYTVHKGKEEGLCVHMPGGRRETIESLREQGFVVSMPKLMRFLVRHAAEAAASEAPSLPFDGPTFGRFNKETS